MSLKQRGLENMGLGISMGVKSSGQDIPILSVWVMRETRVRVYAWI